MLTFVLGLIAQFKNLTSKQTVETYAEVVEIQKNTFATRPQVSEDQFLEYVADFLMQSTQLRQVHYEIFF